MICAALTACSGLLPDRNVGECYSVNNLNPKQRSALNVGSGNPILLIGNEEIVCSCYQSGSVIGVGEGGRVIGSSEDGRVAGSGEDGRVVGSGEDGRVVGSGEDGRVVGSGEDGRVVGDGENGRVVGDGEYGRVIGDGETGDISGDFSKLSCRIVPECSGYQLIGYPPKQIDISNGNRRKSVSTSCIIW
ncbi:Collagen triple helix repeat-containing protein [Candidatus Electrothrix laxa]